MNTALRIRTGTGEVPGGLPSAEGVIILYKNVLYEKSRYEKNKIPLQTTGTLGAVLLKCLSDTEFVVTVLLAR